MSKKESILSAEILREKLRYDAETGLFHNRINRGGTARAGTRAGFIDMWGYQKITVACHHYMAQRLAWLYVHGVWPAEQLDHINRIKTDNRIANLREVSASLNTSNRVRARIDNKLGALGVSATGKKFRATICANGKCHYLGTFKTVEDASAAYLKAKETMHAGAVIA